jgi:two-component system nitrogen regulation response regulator GlnG
MPILALGNLSRRFFRYTVQVRQKGEETWARYLEVETRKLPDRPGPASAHEVPGLTILHHPDMGRVGERVALPELASAREVRLSRLEPLFAAPGETARRPLADPFLSRQPVRLVPAEGGVRLVCSDATTPALADGMPVADERLCSAEDLEGGVVLVLTERVVLLLHLLNPSPPKGVPSFGMVGESPSLVRVRQEIRQLADLGAPVLLRGETGTGKELVARAIHRAGPRRSRPFVAVNMGAIPATLAAAELFGAAKGAFTGAERRQSGYFQRADGGTLFLDEIGEMPPEVQTALLRTLESGEVQPVGAAQARRVDVQVIAATDADLEAEIAAQKFRAPLLHRLSGYELCLPALRERRDDVGRLLVHFLRQELETVGEGHRLEDPGPEGQPWLPALLVARLAGCRWPGNVRQLRNVARQLVAASHGQPEARITAPIERLLEDAPPPAPPARSRARRAFRSAEEIDEDELLSALAANRWRLQPTAAQLGISRTSLYRLIDRSPEVRKPRDLSREEIERCHQRCGGNLEAMVDELRVSRKGLRRRMTQLKLP